MKGMVNALGKFNWGRQAYVVFVPCETAAMACGTTTAGGANAASTVFKITSSDKLTTLYSLCCKSHCTDGEFLVAGLVPDTNLTVYGSTENSGVHPDGTVFSLSVGQDPWQQCASGTVGGIVKILGPT